ncbi:MAG: hypothetical protein JNK85_22170 [Verrucomicrobiales bacterium]|nr:hypothetical protein [Verrucomicrobiales bacterium]
MTAAHASTSARLSPPSHDGWPGWTMIERSTVASTNDEASSLPAWSSVRADRQTAGRGRYQRSWVSDAGGLWLSAVVPVGPPDQGWPALPLGVGAVLCETFARLGARGLHLRWPNDVMAGEAKLAGILIDQFRPGLAVVGLGVNVRNEPEGVDPGLRGAVVRLADLVDPVPGLTELAGLLLRGLRGLVDEMHASGFASQVPRVNRWWETDILLEVETASELVEAVFAGVDSTGRLQLHPLTGGTLELEAHQVQRLRELKRGKR